jgi:ketopantoate reductase
MESIWPSMIFMIFFFEACRSASENISSMLIDLINGRRTEIDALNGEIVTRGLDKGVQVDTHQTMVELVKLREKWGTGFQQQV